MNYRGTTMSGKLAREIAYRAAHKLLGAAFHADIKAAAVIAEAIEEGRKPLLSELRRLREIVSETDADIIASLLEEK